VRTTVAWTAPAFGQLEDLPSAIAFEIVSRVDLLESFPEMGVSLRSRHSTLRNCRKLIVAKSYRVVYEFDGKNAAIHILAVQHCRQPLPTTRELRRILERREEPSE
jgi:mRNA-degrading endonuclease RelE of RelBE toxin-antitoxin system